MKVKILVAAFGFLIVALLMPSRYLDADGGVTTPGLDYTTHLSISEHISSGDFFPSRNKPDLGRHEVSQYLPIYHGIIGFHILTLFFEKVGIPRPGAYALTLDLCLVSILILASFFLIDKTKLGWRWEYLVAALFIGPFFFFYFTAAVEFAFYSQLLSQAFLLAAGYTYYKGNKFASYSLICIAAFCYPDFLLWILPIFIFSSKKNILFLKIFLSGLWLILFFITLGRLHLSGPTIASPLPFTLIFCILLIFGKDLWRHKRYLFIMTASLVAVSITLGALTYRFGNIGYYASKFLHFQYLLLPLIFMEIRIYEKVAGKVLLACSVFFMFFPQTPWSSLGNIRIFKKPIFSNTHFNIAKNAKSEVINKIPKSTCAIDSTLILFPDGMSNDLNTLAYNSIFLNFDIYSMNLKNPTLNLFYTEKNGSVLSSLVKQQTDDFGSWLAFLDSKIKTHKDVPLDFCLAVKEKDSGLFTESGNFERIFRGAHFVYFKPKKDQN